ncbi:hypothetical protein ACF1BP_37075 [Streptomyces sp. NPDC014735]|uniref:hypothetical protein n=1 Tax=unclassified Streptomyces TaxID=2593676 RepID=UPI0036F804B3
MTTPITAKCRTRRGVLAAVVVLVVGLVAAGALVLNGILPLGGGTTHPPCNQLPNASQAQAALAANPDLVAQLTDQGPGVAVRVDSPGCKDRNRALVEVTYRTADERAGIDAVLTSEDGFGVPVYVHEG